MRLLALFHEPYFDNGLREAMYPTICTFNIPICHQQIQKTLAMFVHACLSQFQLFQNGTNITQTYVVATTIGTLLYINIVLTLSICHNWEPSWILNKLSLQSKIFFTNSWYFPPQKIYLKVNVVKLLIREAGLWKCLISAFHHFLRPVFQNDQGWPSIPSFSLITWEIVINRYVRLENCLLWHV